MRQRRGRPAPTASSIAATAIPEVTVGCDEETDWDGPVMDPGNRLKQISTAPPALGTTDSTRPGVGSEGGSWGRHRRRRLLIKGRLQLHFCPSAVLPDTWYLPSRGDAASSPSLPRCWHRVPRLPSIQNCKKQTSVVHT